MLPYQRKWIADPARFRIALKARQIGWTTVLAFEAVVSAAFKGRDQLIISSAEKNAVEVLTRCSKWVEVLKASGVRFHVSSDSKTELGLGSNKILSLAQNPDTVRGFTGDVYLDEFPHHPNAAEIYEAAFPIITHGYRISIVGTPLGMSGRFYDIWTNEGQYRDYVRHKCDIYQAVADGLRVDIDTIRRNLDEESFRREYLCEFVDEGEAFFPYELIIRCVGARPTEGGRGSVVLGVDIGRKRDLTVVAVLEQLGTRLYMRRLECMKDTPFEVQREAISNIYHEEGAQMMAIDASGLGMQLAEELRMRLGAVEPITFDNAIKEHMAVTLKRLFERQDIVILDDPALIGDIHSLKRTVTASGNFRFDADRTEKGHADRFWALALAVNAATVAEPTIRYL